jgi:hypothetical protein
MADKIGDCAESVRQAARGNTAIVEPQRSVTQPISSGGFAFKHVVSIWSVRHVLFSGLLLTAERFGNALDTDSRKAEVCWDRSRPKKKPDQAMQVTARWRTRQRQYDY